MIKQKNTWTEEEDAAILNLYEQRHVEDWDEVARLMQEELQMPKKTSKMYKDRYVNHLSSTVCKIQWTVQEQELFMKLHNKIGNKWATIAQHLHKKTDNCVKNHFYSKLRKLLRRLNKIIQFYLKKQFRPIDISVMYKIVEAAEERFKQRPNCELEVSLECLNVENKMLQFAMFNNNGANDEENPNWNDKEDDMKYTEENIQEYKQLIKQIYRVSKLYKRKSKKVRNSLIQAPLNRNVKKNKKNNPLLEAQQDSEENTNKNHEKTINKIQTTILVSKLQKPQQQNQEEILQKQQSKKNNPTLNTRIQVEEGEGIQHLLRTAGILHDEVKPGTKETKNRKSSMLSQYSSMNIPSPLSVSQQNFLINNQSIAQYSPLNSFTSQQMQNFLGFPMTNNNNNGYANFTLSQKSSFKSYSQRDPSQIDNPFFDEYSSNNNRMMFPMNFSLPATQQYQQAYNQYGGFQYGNVYFQSQQQGEDLSGDGFLTQQKKN